MKNPTLTKKQAVIVAHALKDARDSIASEWCIHAGPCRATVSGCSAKLQVRALRIVRHSIEASALAFILLTSEIPLQTPANPSPAPVCVPFCAPSMVTR